tara:strand:+ start:220 stop:627 length:408 start_codon:yes stop_codon:yes gene_type:complete
MWYCYNCKKELGDGLWEGPNWDGQDEENKDFDKKREIILDKLKQSLGGNVTINTPFSELPEKYQNELIEAGWNIGGMHDECYAQFMKEYEKEMKMDAYLEFKAEQNKKDELQDELDRIDSEENPDGFDDLYKDDR